MPPKALRRVVRRVVRREVHALVEFAPAARVVKPVGQVAHQGVRLTELPPAENVPCTHVVQLPPPKPGRQTERGRGARGVVMSRCAGSSAG